MKILLVGRCVTSLPPRSGGGAEWHGYHLATTLQKLGHEIHYITNYSRPLNFNGLTTYNTCKRLSPRKSIFPFMSFNEWVLKYFKENILAARKAISVLKKEKNFDIIHCHGNLAAIILSKYRKNIPIIYTEHDSSPWTSAYRSSYERLIRKCCYYTLNKKAIENVSHTIVVSDIQKKFFVDDWGIPKEKITVIHNGVDISVFCPNGNNEYIKKKYSILGEYSIFVGRLESRKGIDYLIKSMKNINLTSVIVGDGPEKDRLENLAITENVKNKIILTGSISEEDLKSLYSGAKFFVLPSISEGLPLTVLEAMSSGIPVVASNVGGLAEVLVHGYNGFLVNQNDVISLIDAQQTLNKDTSLCQEMGKRARDMIKKDYSWNIVTKKVLEVYDRVVG